MRLRCMDCQYTGNHEGPEFIAVQPSGPMAPIWYHVPCANEGEEGMGACEKEEAPDVAKLSTHHAHLHGGIVALKRALEQCKVSVQIEMTPGKGEYEYKSFMSIEMVHQLLWNYEEQRGVSKTAQQRRHEYLECLSPGDGPSGVSRHD